MGKPLDRGFSLAAALALAGLLAAGATVRAEGTVDAVAEPCAAAMTQAELNRCAHEDFLAASADYAERYRALSQRLPAAQRERLRRAQSAWLPFRTAACRFEAGPADGGSAQDLVYWRCAARMTRERAAELARPSTCREGDLACPATAR